MEKLLDRTFSLTARETSVRRECLAGLTTFSTMAYILFVNPLILSGTGMDFGAVMVATVLASALASLVMGFYANYPFAQAPGMGLNAYFAFGVVLGEGHSWQVALGAAFWAGLAFLILTACGWREALLNALPVNIRRAVTAGMGLFLAFIGLKNTGIIVADSATLVALGDLTIPSAYLAGLGVVVTAALMFRGVGPAMLVGILCSWLIGLSCGLVEWQGLVASPPSLAPTFGQLDIWGALHPDVLPVVLTFIFIALFDTAGALMGLADQAGFLNKDGKLPRVRRSLYSDAIGTMAGAGLGTSPVTTFLESASGIAAGGRTGLTGVIVGLMFLLSLFLSPLAASIPLFATTPALVIIGALMLRSLAKINWEDLTELIPAFITFATIPLTFSIATGIGLGFIAYPLIKAASGRTKEVHWLVWVLGALFALKLVYLG